MSPVPKLNQNVLGPNLDMNYRYQGWGYRAVTKISSSWYVTAISRRGIKQLGTFWVLFSFFFHESNQGSFTYQLGKTPGPWSLVIVLLGNKKFQNQTTVKPPVSEHPKKILLFSYSEEVIPLKTRTSKGLHWVKVPKHQPVYFFRVPKIKIPDGTLGCTICAFQSVLLPYM